MPHSKYLKALYDCNGPWAATCSQGTNFQERQDQQTYPIILEQSKWSMKRGISDSEITVSNGVEFPVRMDLSLSLYSEFLNNRIFFLLGRCAEFNLYHFDE